MASHKDARGWAIAGTEAALGREPTLAEVQFVQAVALGESGYGAGWKDDGAGSWNMGAVQAGKPPCDPATSFLYTDSHPQPDGSSVKYEWCYRKYPTPEAGMQAVANILYNQMSIDPSSIEAVSTQMYDKHYYEGFGATREERIAGHIKGLTNNLQKITTALNEPMPPLTDGEESSDNTGIVLAFVTVLLVGGALLARRKGMLAMAVLPP